MDQLIEGSDRAAHEKSCYRAQSIGCRGLTGRQAFHFCNDQDRPIIAYIDLMLKAISGVMKSPNIGVNMSPTRISMP